MNTFSLERLGIRNLDFTGEIIGQSAGANPSVKIYRTQGQKYIGQLEANKKFSQAQNFDKPKDLIDWFSKVQCGINSDTQDAIEDAAKNDKAFEETWNEHVD